MPKSCVAYKCHNHNLSGKKVSFHVFPKDPKRRTLWICAVNRAKPDKSLWSPTKHAVLCGEHFIQGKPHKDPSHPDFIPSLFPHLPQNTMESVKKHERVSCKRKLSSDSKENTSSNMDGSPIPSSTDEAFEIHSPPASPLRSTHSGINTSLDLSLARGAC